MGVTKWPTRACTIPPCLHRPSLFLSPDDCFASRRPPVFDASVDGWFLLCRPLHHPPPRCCCLMPHWSRPSLFSLDNDNMGTYDSGGRQDARPASIVVIIDSAAGGARRQRQRRLFFSVVFVDVPPRHAVAVFMMSLSSSTPPPSDEVIVVVVGRGVGLSAGTKP